MKKQVLTLLTCLFAMIDVKAQAPDWSVNASDYANSMVVVGALKIGGQELADTDDIVAAFVDGEVRGVAQPTLQDDGRYLAIMLIYSNGNIEEISFKAYVNDSGAEVDIAATLQFEADALIGDALQPYLWSDVILNNEAELLSFVLTGQEGATVIEDSLISITMPYDADLSSVEPVSSLSEGASLLVDGQVVTAGASIDVTELVEMEIRSEDEQNFSEYVLSVTLGDTIIEVSTAPTDILLSKTTILENQDAGTEVGTLSTIDANQTDNHSFELVVGEGDTDNDLFLIDGNSLKTFTEFDFETDSVYSIRLKVTDADGESFEKVVQINVLNLDDVVTGIEEQIGFEMYPNPVTDHFTLRFNSDYVGALRMELFTLSGNKVGDLLSVKQSTSVSRQYDLSSLSAGMHIMRLQMGQETIIRKFIVIR